MTGPGSSDSAFLAGRIRTGDIAAFETLFHAYRALMYRCARRITHDCDTAEDLVQEVFGWVWAHRATWQPQDTRAYLLTMVRRRALDRIRRQNRQSVLHLSYEGGECAPAMGEPARLPDAVTEATDRWRRIEQAIATLPRTQQWTLHLRWWYDMPWQKISVLFGLSHDAIRQQHARVLTRLRQEVRYMADV